MLQKVNEEKSHYWECCKSGISCLANVLYVVKFRYPSSLTYLNELFFVFLLSGKCLT